MENIIAYEPAVVLDACAIIAFLANETGAEFTENILINNSCYMHALNVCEVYYNIARSAGTSQADAFVRWLTDEAGVVIRTDIDQDLWIDAGIIKATLRRISLADCFCVALARRLHAPVITADHTEFKSVQSNSYCSVTFIR